MGERKPDREPRGLFRLLTKPKPKWRKVDLTHLL